LDLIRERKPPFSPEAVTEEFAKTIRGYRCTKVWGDRYGGEWPREQFRNYGVDYEPSEKPKSDLYKELLAPINSGALAIAYKNPGVPGFRNPIVFPKIAVV
jgi:hypothetical protein